MMKKAKKKKRKVKRERERERERLQSWSRLSLNCATTAKSFPINDKTFSSYSSPRVGVEAEVGDWRSKVKDRRSDILLCESAWRIELRRKRRLAAPSNGGERKRSTINNGRLPPCVFRS
ncbi:hypothetical protein ACLB2K_014531 [Fragaria x ananassa]